MKSKPLFLYNYAAELHEIREYDHSLQILHECEELFNDYDLQLLMAENYLKVQNYEKAEKYYRTASYMCPNRFLPLSRLVDIYERTNREDQALTLARTIVDKPVKVSSQTVFRIKARTRGKLSRKTLKL